MSEALQGNQDGLRSPTGEIKDQSPGTTETKTELEKKPGTEPSLEVKPEAKDDKSLLNQDDGKKNDAPSGAPEKYEAFKAPEGFVITDEAHAVFKEAGLSQATAQKLIDYVAPQIQELLEGPEKLALETRQNWRQEAMDKYGSKISDVKVTVSRAIDSVLGQNAKAFKEAMDFTGAGDHPALIDGFYEFAKRLSEGTHVRGSGPSKLGQVANAKPVSPAKAMYPNLPSAYD